MCETLVCENCDLTGERYVGGAGKFCELCNPKPMLAPVSCPNCFDSSDCSSVEICRAVEEVYSAPLVIT